MTSQPSHPKSAHPKGRLRWLVLPTGLVVLYIVLPQFKEFHSSLATIRHAQAGWLVAGLAAIFATYFAAAGIYVLLVQKPLAYGRTLLVQVASMFANRLLPAGIGAIGINYKYLRRNKHTRGEAVAIVTVNNTLGFIGNMLLLAGVVVFSSVKARDVRVPHIGTVAYAVAILVLLLALIVGLGKYRDRIGHKIRDVWKNISNYRRHPLRLLAALASSVILTASYTLCLYACLSAIGLHLSFAVVFVVMSLGVAGGTAIPTPGGLGGAEAGLVAGMLFYGVSSSNALAAALLYRLFTYWLALLAGTVAFIYVGRRQYI